MYIKPSDMKPKLEKQPCNINLTKTAIFEKGKSPIFDVEITGGWSIKPTQNQKLVDQIYHFSTFFCLIILACYIIAVHTLLYYETQDTASLRNKVDYAFTLNEELKNRLQSLEFTVDGLQKDMNTLRNEMKQNRHSSEDLFRKRRSVIDQKDTSVRPRTTENVAMQFTPYSRVHYERNPMGGILGPWISDPDAIGRNEKAFGVTYKFHQRQIQVSRSGLYLIYSQIMYYPAKHRSTGVYSINLISATNSTAGISPTTNSTTEEPPNEPIAACSINLYNVAYHQSCYTSTIRLLRSNDTLYLQQVTDDTRIYFEPDSTFFGLILLSES